MIHPNLKQYITFQDQIPQCPFCHKKMQSDPLCFSEEKIDAFRYCECKYKIKLYQNNCTFIINKINIIVSIRPEENFIEIIERKLYGVEKPLTIPIYFNFFNTDDLCRKIKLHRAFG